jgi:hypothetical protein
MDSYYIFQYRSKQLNEWCLVVFCAGTSLDSKVLEERLRGFFERNRPPKSVLIIGGHYLKEELKGLTTSAAMDALPSFLRHDSRIEALTFDEQGELYQVKTGARFENQKEVFEAGFLNIFRLREGLITASSENYHFVFPSGKHSPFFIRTGNILLNGSEIAFLAVPMLRNLTDGIKHIYCDTSSINSLAFALIDLKRRFRQFETPTIVSFSSYSQFESFEFRSAKHSLVFISASTSGNLIRRLRTKNPNIREENVVTIIYFCDAPTTGQVLFNLATADEGLYAFLKTNQNVPNEIDCKLCEDGSYPLQIQGDIFLLEKPKINSVQINKNDRPAWLNRFMEVFHSRPGSNFIRCFYGEERFRRFDIYFDTLDVLRFLKEETARGIHPEFEAKLQAMMRHTVPGALDKILHLDDEGSKQLAEFLAAKYPHTSIQCTDTLFERNDEDDLEKEGAILVICSTIATGNSALYVSKYLRRYKNMTKTFLVLFARTENEKEFDFIKSNIAMGEYGPNTNPLTVVERVECPYVLENPTEIKKLTWSLELDFLYDLRNRIEEDLRFKDADSYIKNRIRLLEEASDNGVAGLTNEVFLRSATSGNPLLLNPSFAFFDFKDYYGKTSQADVYFTISSILNNLRYAQKKDKKIIQEEHIRTIIDPRNFDRYNDGVIQASILRAARPQELNYRLDERYSGAMVDVMVKMVQSFNDQLSSEALPEFLLAMCLKRMKLLDLHLKRLIGTIEARIDNHKVLVFNDYLKTTILGKAYEYDFKGESDALFGNSST